MATQSRPDVCNNFLVCWSSNPDYLQPLPVPSEVLRFPLCLVLVMSESAQGLWQPWSRSGWEMEFHASKRAEAT